MSFHAFSRSIKRSTIVLGLALLASSPLAMTSPVTLTQAAATGATTRAVSDFSQYFVQVPKIDPIYAGATTITGKTSLTDAPAGTSFTAVISFDNNVAPTYSSPVDGNGTFSVPVPAVNATKAKVTIQATNGGVTRSSTTMDIPIATQETDPIAAYHLPDPVLDNQNVAATGEITGKIDLTGAPSNQSVVAVLLDANGDSLTGGTVAPDGTFSIPLSSTQLTVGDTYYVQIGLIAQPFVKVSTAVPVQIVANDLANYTVPAPSLNPLTTGDTSISGRVTLPTAPAGTTFTAMVTLPDGSMQTAAVNADGTFTINIPGGALSGQSYRVSVTATLDPISKTSPEVTAVATDPVPHDNPLANYTVNGPTLNPITEGDTQLSGMVNISDAPSGTSFTATVTLPDGSTQTVNVDAQGHFIATVPAAVVGAHYSVVITANNDGYNKVSNTASTIAQAKPDQNPLADYAVHQPVINPIKTGDTTLTGHVDIAGAPAGTVFFATVTLADGTTKQVLVNAKGEFVVEIPAAKAGQSYQVTILAQNSGHTKQGPAATAKVPNPVTPGNPGNRPNPSNPATPSGQQPGHGNQTLPATSDAQNVGLLMAGVALLLVSGLLFARKRQH